MTNVVPARGDLREQARERGAVAPPHALAVGLLRCLTCGLALQAPAESCPRCDSAVHPRKPNANQRAAAFLLAALILYLPANLLPIMRVSTLFDTTNYTILTGILQLWDARAWDLAVIVFVASMMVPLGKILGLGVLVWTAQKGSRWRRGERTRLYRLVEFVGRWAMLDIFVVAILGALVQFGAFEQVEAQPGALAFAAVVILTTLAAESFDSRAMWDDQPRG